MNEITYQTNVCIAGTFYACVESYESIHARLADSALGVSFGEESADGGDGQVRYAPFLELTISTEWGPQRASVSPMAISLVLEVPADHRTEVTFPERGE